MKSDVDVLWSHSIAFQKFQRCVHGEITEQEYIDFLFSHAVEGEDRVFPLYTNDADVFSYRPGHDATIEDEYASMERLLRRIASDKRVEFITPGMALFEPRDRNQSNIIKLESVETPVVCKKQDKYNPLRWAAAGRDSVHINTECHKVFESIRALNEQGALEKDTLESYKEVLCELWGSDFRTNTIDEKFEVVIVTADKDMEQLLNPKVKILHAEKGEMIDPESLFKGKGIRPEQVVDVLALSGDSSDNVPGVPGIGAKTALELIQKWGSLQSVLMNVNLITGKKRQENLRLFADQARLSQKLLVLYRDIPISLDMNACKLNTTENTELKNLFRAFGFQTLLTDMVATAKMEETQYHLVDTIEKFYEFLDQLVVQRIVAVDLETTHTNPLAARIVGISFSWQAREAHYIPLMAPEGTACLSADIVLSKIRAVLENKNIKKIGQNIKYDLLVFRKNDILLQGIVFDTMIASYLLNPGKRNHNLDDIAFEYLSYKTITTSEVIGSGKEQITMDKADVAKVCEYACQDADISFRLAGVMEPRLKENALSQLLQDVEIPLIYVLAEMEWDGICADIHVLKEMSDILTMKLQLRWSHGGPQTKLTRSRVACSRTSSSGTDRSGKGVRMPIHKRNKYNLAGF